MSVVAPETRKSARTKKTVFRVDIQALRTIAILAVVLNHLWPARLTGGFVGVDIFFVISGFLITAHLFREIERTGTIRLREFYARRIRRLLPAALLVLAVTLIGVWLLLPQSRWISNAWQIGASALYVENWALAASSVDYFAHDAAASAVQHYWSLSVEEQFYIVWPVLMLLSTVWIAKGRGSLRARAITALGVLGVAAFVSSILFTAAQPAAAYFATFTRAWEFAIGGLIALIARDRALPKAIGLVLVALGLAALGYSIVTFTGAMAFPGYIALVPVLGTAAIIVGGSGAVRLPVWQQLAGNRVVQWFGDISYSWYLWHWPLIVLVPFLIATPLGTKEKALVLVASIVLAWLTRRFVEVPGMKIPALVKAPWRTFVAMLIAMALIVGGSAAVWATGKAVAANDGPSISLPIGDCVGPAALATPDVCNVNAKVTDPESTARDEYFFTPEECGEFLPILSYDDKQTTHTCRFSEEPPTKRVWLVGDSHAQQWQGALFDLARKNNWEVSISFLGGCTVADVAYTGFREPWGEIDRDRCRQYAQDVATEIEKQAPDIVFTSMAARQQLADDGSGRPVFDQMVTGLQSFWDRWVAAGSTVVPIADTPLNGQVRSPDCVVLSAMDPSVCAVAREAALPTDPLVTAAAAGHPGVHLLDLSDRMCDDALCFAAVGGIAVFYDADHLSLEYVRLLVPEFETRLNDILAAP